MKIVISIGGSLMTEKLTQPTYGLNFKKYVNRYKLYAKTIEKVCKKHEIVVVVGGGSPARVFQTMAREFTHDRNLLDGVGIVATDLNASLFIAAMDGYAHGAVLKTPADVGRVSKELKGKKVIVCSGFEPGSSTDLDAALHAEKIGAKLLINATNVDGVYTADPRKYPKARKLDRLGYRQFRKILSKVPQTPGNYGLFDLKAVDIIERKKIRLLIINGRNPKNIVKAVEGKEIGTVVE